MKCAQCVWLRAVAVGRGDSHVAGLVVALGLSQAVWLLKCQALTEKMWIDDTEMEEEGVAEMLLDENETAQAPRCVACACTRLARCRVAGTHGGNMPAACG